MFTKDSKKMAGDVLNRAFGRSQAPSHKGSGLANTQQYAHGKEVGMYNSGGEVGNYPAPKKKNQMNGMGSGSEWGSNFPKAKSGSQGDYDLMQGGMRGGGMGNYEENPQDDQEMPEFAEGGEVDVADGDVSEGHKVAAEEIMSALESKDPKKLAESLYAFWMMCEGDEMSEGEPSEGMDGDGE